MTTADQYIDRVLALLPTATPMREQIATELRGFPPPWEPRVARMAVPEHRES